MAENDAEIGTQPADFSTLRHIHRRNKEQVQDITLKHGVNPIGEKKGLVSDFSRALTVKELEGTVDKLTGLLNKNGFHERLDETVNTARRLGTKLVAAVLDADGLKPLNDSKGHKAGDEYLAAIGTALLQGKRAGDIVGRVGGDEFKLVFINPGQEGVRAWWNRQEAIFHEKDIRMSVGLTEMNLSDVEASFNTADEAMYAAKLNKGDNASHLFIASRDNNEYNFEEYRAQRAQIAS